MIAGVTSWRTPVLVAYDVLAWVAGMALMALVQYRVGYSPVLDLSTVVTVGLLCGLLFVALGFLVRLHHGRATVGSFDDAVLVSSVGTVVWSTLVLLNLAFTGPLRVSVTVTGPVLTFALIFGARVAFRMLREWSELHAHDPDSPRAPVVIIGAGIGGAQLVGSMLRHPECPWRPVALVDDDPNKRHRRIHGVPVAGRAADFVEVAAEHLVTTVIMAVPSASSDLVRRYNREAVAAGIELKVVPSVPDLTNPAQLEIADVRDIEVTDFLGRTPIETDVESIAGYLNGRRVLVTGAGGSIGSELCRQIAPFSPSELIMLDRDESALHGVQLSIEGRALLNSGDIELADIRDERRIREIFARRRPEVVFHAAALKHLPLLEIAPSEAIKTNVWGTKTILDAAHEFGVSHFVNISTDKAANPCSVLGYSKRLSEGLTASVAAGAPGSYLSVRFGNVLGSRGSVLTTFTAQIANGGPVTVTHPQVTRYFMTIREAVQLVIQAGALGGRGDVLVLDMGEAVAIRDVAEQLIDISGKSADIVYTGLREGEKLHEELFGVGETDERPSHPLISHVPVPGFSADAAMELDCDQSTGQLIADLRRSIDDMGSSRRDAPVIALSRRSG